MSEQEFGLEYRLTNFNIPGDEGPLHETRVLGWNLSADGVREFLKRYPDERFIIGVRE